MPDTIYHSRVNPVGLWLMPAIESAVTKGPCKKHVNLTSTARIHKSPSLFQIILFVLAISKTEVGYVKISAFLNLSFPILHKEKLKKLDI